MLTAPRAQPAPPANLAGIVHLITIEPYTVGGRTRSRAACPTLPEELLRQIEELAPPWRNTKSVDRDVHRLLCKSAGPAIVWFNAPQAAAQIEPFPFPHEPIELGKRDPHVEVIALAASPHVSSARTENRSVRIDPPGIPSLRVRLIWLLLLILMFWNIMRQLPVRSVTFAVMASYLVVFTCVLVLRPAKRRPFGTYLCSGGVYVKFRRALRGTQTERFLPEKATLMLRPGVSPTYNEDWIAHLHGEGVTRAFGVTSMEAVALVALWRSPHRPLAVDRAVLPD